MTTQPISQQLEAQIRNHRLFEFPVDWSRDLIFPYYDGLSLPNIAHSITQALGVPMPDAKPLLSSVWQADAPQARRVITFLLDGTGYKHLQMLMEEDSELKDAVLELNDGREVIPLTSVAPSTTVVALTSTWTGTPPGVTGMTGTYMFLRELSTLGDMLAYKPVIGKHTSDVFAEWNLAPEQIVTTRGMSEHLKDHDVATYTVTNRIYVGSGLSRILHKGVENIITHINLNDFMGQVEQVIEDTQGTRSHIGIYWSGVDALAHRYGAHHKYTNQAVREKILALRDLTRQEAFKDGETLLLFFADHGHYDSTIPIPLGESEEITNAIQMGVSGDERHAYIYIKHGTIDRIQDYILTHYSDRLTAVESQQAVDLGYFGANPSDKLLDRIGDLILIPRLGFVVQDPAGKPLPVVSRHAGLSDWEMIVPFMWKLS